MIQLYSLFDKKAGSYSKPFFVAHIAEAMRSVQMALEDGKSMFAKFPADYALYLMGTFDESTGFLTPPASGMPQFSIEVISLVSVNQFPGGAQ